MEPFELRAGTAGIGPDAGTAATPAYRLDRPTGRFLPANDAAHAECRRWNEYAYQTMRRAGTLPPHWGEHHPRDAQRGGAVGSRQTTR